jgi:Uncharacterized low-complexity proteins
MATRDPYTAKIKALKLSGFGGLCGVAAVEINNKVFKGKGTLVAALNKWWWKNFKRAIGHAAVKYRGKYYDAEGLKDLEDIESWGMLDPGDPDYEGSEENIAEWLGVDPDSAAEFEIPPMTEDDFYEVILIETDEGGLSELFGGVCGANGDLVGMLLAGADPKTLNLRKANFEGVDLHGINLAGADLTEAVMEHANFSGADFTGANLTDALLSYADMSGADFTGAKLDGADMSSTVLDDANLTGADLTGAALFHVRGLETVVGLDTVIGLKDLYGAP